VASGSFAATALPGRYRGLEHVGNDVWMRPWLRRLDCYSTWPCLCTLVLLVLIGVLPDLYWYSLSNSGAVSVTIAVARVCNVSTTTVRTQYQRGSGLRESRTCLPVHGGCPSLCGLHAGCGAQLPNTSAAAMDPWVPDSRVQVCTAVTDVSMACFAFAAAAALWLARNAVRVHLLSVYIEKQHQQPPSHFHESTSWKVLSLLSCSCLRGPCGDDIQQPDWSPAWAMAMTVLPASIAIASLAVLLSMVVSGMAPVVAFVDELCSPSLSPPAVTAADAAFWRSMLCVPPVRVSADAAIAVISTFACVVLLVAACVLAILTRLPGEWRGMPRHERQRLRLG
jgi:hypothetical protein